MIEGRRRLIVALAAGVILRAVALPLAGTGDTLIWKVWSDNAAHDMTGVYGVGGDPPVRRVLRWQNEEMTVDYPPLAVAELAVVGHAYHLLRPQFDDTRWLNVFVKLPGQIAECALVAWMLLRGRRLFGARAEWAALVFWLNPLVLMNGAVLGYLDAQGAVPIVFAALAAWTGMSLAAGLLTAIAVLTKAQAVFVLPAVAMTVYRRGARVAGLAQAAIGGLATTTFVVVPYVARGAWHNLVQAVGRLATHDMLSAQAANVWWIFTWCLRVADVRSEWGWWRALTQPVRILGITRAEALGYPNPREIGFALVVAAIGWACWRSRRLTGLSQTAALAAWCAYAYAMLAAQVHENHWYPIVPFLGLAASADRRYTGPFVAISAIAALNLLLFYGFGSDWPTILPRWWTGIDTSVLLAFVNVGVFAWFGWKLATAQPGPAQELWASTPSP